MEAATRTRNGSQFFPVRKTLVFQRLSHFGFVGYPLRVGLGGGRDANAFGDHIDSQLFSSKQHTLPRPHVPPEVPTFIGQVVEFVRHKLRG